MPTLNPRLACMALALAATAIGARAADPLPEGYLCCNMRTDGSWISDINYAEAGRRIIPAGTPLKATDYGRYRVYVQIAGGKQAIGNDYSRDLALPEFARRYIVADDPAKKIAGFPEPMRKAIEAARVKVGMTREQVLMAVGYPVSSENPSLNATIWRLWLSSFAEFQVVFGADDRVKEIVADPQTRNLVVAE